MKIDFLIIVLDHFRTLRNNKSNRFSIVDIVIFYISPLILSTISYIFLFKLKDDFYNVSISFFGIFIALLLNIQVAMFSIFQRNHKLSIDEKIADLQLEEISIRNKILSELNSNISYSILICCFALLFSLIFYVIKIENVWPTAIIIAVYVHFILVLFMIVKRSYVLFQKEYTDNSNANT